MTRAHGVLALAVLASAGTATGQVFFDEPSWSAASSGNFVAPDYVAIGPTLFPEGTTNLGGFFDVTVELDPVTGGTFNPDFDAELNSVPNFVFDFDPVDTVTFTFPTPITSFAALWSNTFLEDGFRVSTPFNDYDLNVLADPLNATFIGVVEATPFSTLTITTSSPTQGNDFVFFRQFNYYEIPAPGSAALLAIGGFAAARRRR